MSGIIHLSEILGTIDGGGTEICATADAKYNPSTSQVSVVLDAFARHVVAVGDGQHLTEPWLPHAEVVTEHLPREDVTNFARDAFHSWTRKVRCSVPPEVPLRN